ncbi:MAG: hypothetical protein JWR16_1199 [Nevskia sp.]|nr:hypothetical protein [Nevskia sp.]
MKRRRVSCRLVASIAAVFLSVLLWHAAASADAAAAPAQQDGTRAPAFRPDTESDAHRIIVAASFLLLLGLGGAGTVFYARRGGLVRLKLAVDVAPMRVISARRVTARLTLVKVRIDDQKTVVIADNGSHLLLVAENVHDTAQGSTDA